MSDTPTDRVRAYLDAWDAHPHPTSRDCTVASFADGDTLWGLTSPDLRGVLRERDELAEKLAIAMRTIAAQADTPRDTDLKSRLDDALQAYRKLWEIMDELHVRVLPIAGPVGIPIDTALMRQQPRTEHGYAPDAADRVAALPDAVITLTGTLAISHFSPGYDGEKPDHQGPENTCAMPACVKRRSQHEAAAEIQDLTHEILRDHEDTPDAEPVEWLIWSHEYGAWWRPYESGYTTDQAEAGTYEPDYARNICRAANARPDWPGGMSPEVAIPYTDDPQTAATAIRKATQHWITDRSAAPTSTGRETTP